MNTANAEVRHGRTTPDRYIQKLSNQMEAPTHPAPPVDIDRLVRLYCCCCGKQAIREGKPPRHDKYTTTLEGARAGFSRGEVFCGYCAEEMDENGLFPEEQAQAYGFFLCRTSS